MKGKTLLVLKGNIKEGDKLWNIVASDESVSDSSVGILIGISDSSKSILYENKTLGVDNSYKYGGELGCKEYESPGVSEWCVDDTPGGNILGTNVCNDVYISIRISEWDSDWFKEIILLEL